jgi:hypothetical protein
MAGQFQLRSIEVDRDDSGTKDLIKIFFFTKLPAAKVAHPRIGYHNT